MAKMKWYQGQIELSTHALLKLEADRKNITIPHYINLCIRENLAAKGHTLEKPVEEIEPEGAIVHV